MLMSPHVRRITSLRDDSGIRPFGTISIQLLAAIGLVVSITLSAIKTRVRLSTNANSLACFDQSDLWADAECCADDFCGFFVRKSLPFRPSW